MGELKDLLVYKKAFVLEMGIFEISKQFSKEEKYSLTDQIRKSSRSVCANLAEAYQSRNYAAHFISKLTDSDAENSETGVWLDLAFACKYLSQEEFDPLIFKKEEVGRLLGDVIKNPAKYT